MEKAMPGDVVCFALHVNRKAEGGERGKGVFKVSVSQLTNVRFPVKVGVVANNLREICVSRAAQ